MQNRDNIAPLDGILVVDLSQFLSGPCASLRLADLGARVIKIEKPVKGDLCRQLYVSDVVLDGESTVFHAINRNKESFVADLKTPEGLEQVKKLIRRADVVMHNFRPGVAERLGLGYEAVRQLNPQVVYGQISGYGQEGPWRDLPGQDLLLQSLSGLAWLSGDAGQGPVPMGLAIADILCGMHLAQGILACLVRRSITGQGGLVDVSMLESVLDFQFETITTYFHDGGQPTQRTASNNAHAYLGAPYGVYRTRDGYLALAMGRVPQLGELLGCDPLRDYQDPATWFTERDHIKAILADHLATNTTPTGCPFSNPPTSGAPTYWIGSGCFSTTASKCWGCCRRYAAATERRTAPHAAQFASTASGFTPRKARPTSVKIRTGSPGS